MLLFLDRTRSTCVLEGLAVLRLVNAGKHLLTIGTHVSARTVFLLIIVKHFNVFGTA